MPDAPRSPRFPSRAASDPGERRAELASVIPRRRAVSWAVAVALAVGFAALLTPAITAEGWLLGFSASTVTANREAPFTVRAPMLAVYDDLRVRGGVVVARGEPATAREATLADAIADAMPRGPALSLAVLALTLVLSAIFIHHMRRSIKGRLVRVQVVSLATIAVLAVVVKIALLASALSPLVVPVAVLALVPTMVLDRIVGLATGVLAALVVSLLTPFDVGLAILLLVQAATAGLVVAERPKRRWSAALTAGLATTACTSATYLLLTYLTTGHAPELRDPLHSAWVAAAIGPAIAALLAVPLIPLYQRLVGEITQNKLYALEDLGHPLLRQIAEKSPGTWQHSLMMANMAEIAANAIGANGRLVRVGAYFHDLGKSLQPKYFIENLEPGETSPHDRLPPEVSCDAIFAHVTEGIVAARKAGLHERIIDFMHMHHGSGVLEYFWARCREQGNPHGFTAEDFRYPGHPPQSRETAILTICDAVEAASRTLKRPDAAAIDSLVQRIVYGKLHLGQLDESGLSMSDLRRISDSLRETIRHANHGRIEYPWQKAEQDASASALPPSGTAPRLDSLDRRPAREPTVRPAELPAADRDDALAATDALAVTADVRSSATAGDAGESRSRAGRLRTAQPSAPEIEIVRDDAIPRDSEPRSRGITAPRGSSPTHGDPPDPPAGEPTRAPEAMRDHGGGARDGGPSPATTLPGRAPGPLALGAEPAPAPSGANDDPAPEAHARKRAATLPPAQPRRPPTAPPVAARAVAEPARTAGPPAPIDLDNAITNPPPLRRGPSGHPPLPSDPAQLAAQLAATVSRSAAGTTTAPVRASTSSPYTGPRRDDLGHGKLDEAIVEPPAGAPARFPARHPDLDAAITSPPPYTATRAPSAGDARPAASSSAGARATRDGAAETSARPVPVPAVTVAAAAPTTRDGAAKPTAAERAAPAAPAAASSAAALRPAPAPDAPVAESERAPADAGSGPAPTSHATSALVSALASGQAFGHASIDGGATQPLLPRIALSSLDSAVTQPSLPRATPPASQDSAITQPSLPRATTPAAVSLDSAVTRPALPTAPAYPTTLPGSPSGPGSPAGAVTPGYPTTIPGSAPGPSAGLDPGAPEPRRTSGLVGGEQRIDQLDTPLSEPITIRPRRASAEARGNAATTPAVPPRAATLGAELDGPDAGATEPSLPVLSVGDQRRIDVPLRAPPAAKPTWTAGLAARVDAALDSNPWSTETPVVPPSRAELRALLGNPDPTRQQPVDEIELLQRRAAELSDAEPPRRSPHPTAEVDPDDIEAAIELAPPARRANTVNALAGIKPKKGE